MHTAGGDPHREPALDDPAVSSLARDLDTPERRAAFAAALATMEGGEEVSDQELAWRAFACALLADELGDDE